MPSNHEPFFPLPTLAGGQALEGQQHNSHSRRLLCTHPASTPGRCNALLKITQAATAALGCWFAFQFQGSRSATLWAG
jgi:hypothetical protein